jgi:hypothetical protein
MPRPKINRDDPFWFAADILRMDITPLKLRSFFSKTGVKPDLMALTPSEFLYYIPTRLAGDEDRPALPPIESATAKNNERRAAKGLGPMLAKELIRKIEGR